LVKAGIACEARCPTEASPTWQLEDRSSGGLLLAASGGAGQNLTLGALIAVRELRAAVGCWAVVRRLNREPNRLEAGVSIISTDQVAITLHAKRHAREDMGFVVDGIDVSTIGTRFDGIYLPPPSRPENPVSIENDDHPDVRVRAWPQRRPDHHPIGLYRGVAQGVRAAARVDWAAVEIASKIGRG
jgi:hypothetical protein